LESERDAGIFECLHRLDADIVDYNNLVTRTNHHISTMDAVPLAAVCEILSERCSIHDNLRSGRERLTALTGFDISPPVAPVLGEQPVSQPRQATVSADRQ
jgi:hypothetical protein